MLGKNTYFIREHVGLLKLSDAYDIVDPETQQQIGIAKEKVSGLNHVLRFFISKQFLPTCVNVYEGSDEESGKLLFSINRGFKLIGSTVTVLSASGQVLGSFKSKVFSLGGAFKILDKNEKEIASVKGNWKGREFKFLDVNENELGVVSMKWAGIGKEMFTSADNYVVNINGEPDETMSLIFLAAGLAIDIVYKEG